MERTSRMFYAACMALCLALTFAQGARAQQGGEHRTEAIRFLASREPQLQQETDPSKRMHLLLYLTPAALYAGEAAKADSYARELLALGVQLQKRPGFGPGMYGDATHVGNMVLGRLALAGGDVGKAKEHLLAAGRVPGSSVLKSFGPNMLLAQELIEKGEREVVVEYLDLCKQFWDMENGKLAAWKAVVREGDMPNFGQNLGTAMTNWRFAK
jgi:hypothetical protein